MKAKCIFRKSKNCLFLVHQQVSTDTGQLADNRQKLRDTKLDISVPIFWKHYTRTTTKITTSNASTSILGQHMV